MSCWPAPGSGRHCSPRWRQCCTWKPSRISLQSPDPRRSLSSRTGSSTNETDETVNKKIKAAFANELKPIVCVGETLEEREAGKTAEIITKQTELALEGLTNEQVESTIIAYEPIWAIGTGKTATSEDANNSVKEIRKKIEEIYGQETASRVIIQYGGSVKSSNAKELFEMSDIDGGLVGGASLKAEEFSKIVNF